MAIIRRFLFDPGNDVLLNIESVNILDLSPPGNIAGIGTGNVLLIGEFENGPFGVVNQVSSATDLATTYGLLGYTYGSVQGNYPCAVSRKADGALTPEFWNGNGFVQLNGKQFGALFLSRVDTSVGSVSLSLQAFVTGAAAFRYSLAPSQVLGLDIGAGPQTATFTATAATLSSSGETFPTTFAGGETLTLGVDAMPNFTVTFLSTDQTQAQVIARINQYAGFALAAVVDATHTSFTGLQKGNQAQFRVVGATGGVSPLTQLGLSVGTTQGTGNVGNIAAVTAAEIAGVVQGAISGTKVEVDPNGALRVSNTSTPTTGFILVTPATTALNLGFVAGQFGHAQNFAVITGVGGAFPTDFAGGETLTMGYDNAPNFTVTFTATETLAQTVTSINAAAGATIASTDGGQLLLEGLAPGGQLRILSSSSAHVLTRLGLVLETVVGASPYNGIVPAGTVVTNASASPLFVTMQDVQFVNSSVSVGGVAMPAAGPFVVKIRHAVDDTTGVLAGAGTLTVIQSAPQLASLACVNLQATTAALTDAQIDAAYASALTNFTSDVSTVARTINIAWSARQSNTLRSQMKANALFASANGCFGRMACIRPPLGTPKALAQSTQAQPGVGATRDQRVIYCYPGANTFVPIIGARGLSGGAGFTATGNVDVGADGFMASILSQLPPEENPGQETPFTTAINGIESTITGLSIPDYISFKAAGIAALRMDGGVAIFQSGVTSVDPLVNSGLVGIARRRMADFVQDSLAQLASGFGKKLSTNVRRKALASEITSFMEQLLNRSNPTGQRIAGYTVDSISANTPDTLAQGLYRIIVNVRTLSSLDSIVLQTTIGNNVAVVVELPAGS